LGSYTLKFVAYDGSTSVSKSIRVLVTDLSVRDAWSEKYWPGVTDQAIIGNAADPDGDGIPNLLEYALDLDPTQSSVQFKPVIGQEQFEGHNYLTLTYVRRTDDANLSFKVVASDDSRLPLSQWSLQTAQSSVAQDGVPPGLVRVKIRDSVSMDAKNARFMRLEVTANEP